MEKCKDDKGNHDNSLKVKIFRQNNEKENVKWKFQMEISNGNFKWEIQL